MKKVILSLAVIALFLFTSYQAFSEEIVLNAKEKGTWEIQNEEGEMIGTMKKEKDGYWFYDKDKQFWGLITNSKELMPRHYSSSYTKITPELAQLYLDLLEALKTIK